jgi:hypothetical protein
MFKISIRMKDVPGARRVASDSIKDLTWRDRGTGRLGLLRGKYAKNR